MNNVFPEAQFCLVKSSMQEYKATVCTDINFSCYFKNAELCLKYYKA